MRTMFHLRARHHSEVCYLMLTYIYITIHIYTLLTFTFIVLNSESVRISPNHFPCERLRAPQGIPGRPNTPEMW